MQSHWGTFLRDLSRFIEQDSACKEPQTQRNQQHVVVSIYMTTEVKPPYLKRIYYKHILCGVSTGRGFQRGHNLDGRLLSMN